MILTNEELIDAFYTSGPTAELSCHRAELLRRLYGPVSTQPMCPKCKTVSIYRLEKLGIEWIECENGHRFTCQVLSDFTQFFTAYL